MRTVGIEGRFDHGEESHRWYVVYTKPRGEDTARDHLERRKISVFLPRIREYHYSSRGRVAKVKPLFPNYLFARMAYPEDYYTVIWAKGVRRVVDNGSEPIPLNDSIVDFFRRQCEENGFIRPSPNLLIGDMIRVRNGPLEGLIGIIDGTMDEKGRVKVLLNFLKEGARVEIPCSFLERQ